VEETTSSSGTEEIIGSIGTKVLLKERTFDHGKGCTISIPPYRAVLYDSIGASPRSRLQTMSQFVSSGTKAGRDRFELSHLRII